MHVINKNKAPLLFNELIKKPVHKYPTKFKESCFSLKTFSLKAAKYLYLTVIQKSEVSF